MTQSVLLPVLVYVVLPLCAGLGAVAVRRQMNQMLRGARAPSPAEEVRARVRDLLLMIPATPSLLTTATSHPLSLQVEARLLSGCPSLALCEAEQEVLDNPGDSGAFIALAKALLYCQREDDARAALRWAQRLGADDPELDYLAARLGGGDLQALTRCLRACFREPAYGEALYLCARLCRRLGFPLEGDRLLRQIAPLMHLSVERIAYHDEVAALDRRVHERGGRRLLGLLGARRVPESSGEFPAPM